MLRTALETGRRLLLWADEGPRLHPMYAPAVFILSREEGNARLREGGKENLALDTLIDTALIFVMFDHPR